MHANLGLACSLLSRYVRLVRTLLKDSHMKQLKEYTDGHELMTKTEWIEWIMMRSCCSKAFASREFKRLVDEGHLVEIVE